MFVHVCSCVCACIHAMRAMHACTHAFVHVHIMCINLCACEYICMNADGLVHIMYKLLSLHVCVLVSLHAYIISAFVHISTWCALCMQKYVP